TLNRHLSNDIRQDLYGKHANSKNILGNHDIGDVVEKIEPLSLEEIFDLWAPDLNYKEVVIKEKDLKNLFDKTGIGKAHFKSAFTDFNHIMFKVNGDLKTLKDYLLTSKLKSESSSDSKVNDAKAREWAKKWYHEVEVLLETRLSDHKACIVLINRLRYLEGSLPRKLVLDEKEFLRQLSHSLPRKELEEVLDDLEKRISGEESEQLFYYDMALFDEVQDLPPQAVVLISYLTRNRDHPHDLMFVGDHAQALNYDDFRWNRFFGDAKELGKDLREQIPEEHPEKHAHHLLHLDELHTREEEIYKLKQNHRNPKIIVESMIRATEWNPLGEKG
ncbi:uncharacterized protein METZ01_LOCUS338679, partial [marine metagenome]